MNLSRLDHLFTKDELLTIEKSHVYVFGIGGVGASACLSLARMGLREISVIDDDVITDSNLNRQAHAFNSSIGEKKVDVIKKLILDINPNCKVNTYYRRITKENINDLIKTDGSFYVDAIDDISGKLAIITFCNKNNLRLISSMGAGNRLDPTKVCISDIFKTENDPLAKCIRSELRKLNIKKLPVVWSTEVPVKTTSRTPSSAVFVPQTFGLTLSYYVIKEITEK
ncbi:MAG: tRNA threonylcarbamoyladenosine dehydratase [Bacilli bacterium]|jgi:tRNA A37 threonylcarbamoyladenosine dehydratase